MSGSLPSQAGRTTSGADRRRDRRYQVELRGEMYFSDKAVPVRIADLSGSGALVYMDVPPQAGTEAELWIEDFGSVWIEIIHATDTFCGVTLIDSSGYRDRLLEWLREEADSPA